MKKLTTYSEIQEWVRRKYGFTPKTCWIAHAKELCGLPVRRASNRQSRVSRKHPCPEDKLPSLKTAFRHFGMLR